MKGKQKNGRPLFVEALEERSLLSASVWTSHGGTRLNIVCDDANDWVQIIQNDSRDMLQVTTGILGDPEVLAPAAVGIYQSSAINTIVIRTGAGDDQVSYRVEGGTIDFGKRLRIDLGEGDDHALVDMGAAIQPLVEVPIDTPIDATDTQILPWIDPTLDRQGTRDALRPYVDPTLDRAGTEAAIDALLAAINAQNTPTTVEGEESALEEFGPIDATLVDFFPLGTQIRADMNVDVDAGAGDDHVTVFIGAVAEGVEVGYRADLGAGSDTGVVRLNGSLAAGADVTVKQRGGQGDDYLDVGTAQPIDVAEGAKLRVAHSGGQGADSLLFGFEGRMDGFLLADTSGGQGDDFIDQRVKLQYQSAGVVDSEVNGDQGADDITHLVSQDLPVDMMFVLAPPATLRVKTKGGAGVDVGHVSAATFVSGLETVSWA